jgi:hypothetical protein
MICNGKNELSIWVENPDDNFFFDKLFKGVDYFVEHHSVDSAYGVLSKVKKLLQNMVVDHYFVDSTYGVLASYCFAYGYQGLWGVG